MTSAFAEQIKVWEQASFFPERGENGWASGRTWNREDAYVRVASGGISGVVHRDWAERLGDPGAAMQEILADPGKILRKGGGQGTTSRREVGGQEMFCKIYLPDRWRRRVRDLFRASRSVREWRANCRAEAAGVMCAPVVAALAARRLLGTTSVFLTLPAEGTSAWELLPRMKEDTEARHVFLRYLGGLTASIHRRGFWHAHWNLKHIFVTDEGCSIIIDLESSLVFPSVPPEFRTSCNLRQIRESLERRAPVEEFAIFKQAYDEGMRR